MSTISIVAAISDNNAIGKNLGLLWHMPADMKRFKDLTTGHAVIMGRKTFESLPKGGLPNRKNVVLTTMPEAGFINCFACESMHDALDICERKKTSSSSEVLWLQTRIRDCRQDVSDRIHGEFPDCRRIFPVVQLGSVGRGGTTGISR